MQEPQFDVVALIAAIRNGDPEAMREAYQRTFCNDMGRLVLAHHLQECGVGNALGKEDLEYRAGRHDGALMLASRAGFDQASLAVAVLTDELRGNEDDGSIDREPRDQWEPG